MLSNPALPLRTLPDLRGMEQEIDWIRLAIQACSDSLQQINSLLLAPIAADRDVHSCLIAIRASLELVLNESLSAVQIAVTVRRSLQVFDRLASTQVFSEILTTEYREMQSIR